MDRIPKFRYSGSLRVFQCKILVGSMGRSAARFRISIKDNQSSTNLKVELIESPGLWGERRFRLRVNGRKPRQIEEATLTDVFERLRRWTVKRM